MTAIAWAIIFATLLVYDVAMIYKFGKGYPGEDALSKLSAFAAVAVIVCTIREWFR